MSEDEKKELQRLKNVVAQQQKQIIEDEKNMETASIKNEGQKASELVKNFKLARTFSLSTSMLIPISLWGVHFVLQKFFPFEIWHLKDGNIIRESLEVILPLIFVFFAILSTSLMDVIFSTQRRNAALALYESIVEYADMDINLLQRLPKFDIQHQRDQAMKEKGVVDEMYINSLKQLHPSSWYYKSPSLGILGILGIAGVLLFIGTCIVILFVYNSLNILSMVALALGLLGCCISIMFAGSVFKVVRHFMNRSKFYIETYITNQTTRFTKLKKNLSIHREMKPELTKKAKTMNRLMTVANFVSFSAILVFSGVSAKSYSIALPILKLMSFTYGRTPVPVGAFLISVALLTLIKKMFQEVAFNKKLNATHFEEQHLNGVSEDDLNNGKALEIRKSNNFFEGDLTKYYVGGFAGIIFEIVMNKLVTDYLSSENASFIATMSLFIAPVVSVIIGVALGFYKAQIKYVEIASKVKTHEELLAESRDVIDVKANELLKEQSRKEELQDPLKKRDEHKKK